MTAITYDQPNISVDVVPFIVDPTNDKVLVVLGKRINKPFLGEYALPGVLLSPHERLSAAGTRALLSKVSVPQSKVQVMLDGGVFDNPDRDPRGATVSITKIAVLEPDALSHLVLALPVSEVIAGKFELPFDHNNIITEAFNVFGEKFLRAKAFTKAVLGENFTTATVRNIARQLEECNTDSGFSFDNSNLTRQLKNTQWFTQEASATSGFSVVHSDSIPGGGIMPMFTAPAASTLATRSLLSASSVSRSKGRPSTQWGWEN